MKDDDVIQWRFENTLIAEINVTADRFTVYDDVLDGRFRDRLKLDNQTGSLTITNTRTEHEGRYELEINSVRNSFNLIVFAVISVNKGDSVTLNSDLTEMTDDDQIYWMFGNGNHFASIADINKQYDIFSVHNDYRFRNRLKLDNQTGSLTITNIRTKNAGVYELQINRVTERFILTIFDEVKEVSVKEGDSVTLNSDLIDRENLWRFKNTLIALTSKRFNSFTVYDDVLDGRFRDRLKLDNQTGSLTITNITTEHDGDYELVMYSSEFSSETFRVSVYNSVHCCGPTEAVIRLVLSALVGVATVIILVYDIRSSRAERDQEQIHTSGN
ncbi:uncharacterized protein LOC125263341 [Megalobrama amblycephala]|uniref:uncharacterized protein LOC125263341 n=1 Tax=Megalobrama amblycephala TaxID=75352 RepID=UPI002013F800|nr:uncharacterized protein LOC125263341 [Megalobrama amblycephala]